MYVIITMFNGISILMKLPANPISRVMHKGKCKFLKVDGTIRPPVKKVKGQYVRLLTHPGHEILHGNVASLALMMCESLMTCN